MSAAGMRAAALCAVRVLGGATVLVRLPSPADAASDTEQLGLPAPEFHDLALTPCVVRTGRDGSRRVTMAAHTLESALDVSDPAAVRDALEQAAFVQIGTESLLLREVQAVATAGCAFLYRLLLREPQAKVRR